MSRGLVPELRTDRYPTTDIRYIIDVLATARYFVSGILSLIQKKDQIIGKTIIPNTIIRYRKEN